MKPRIVKKPPGPRAREVIARDSHVISPSRFHDIPLMIEKAFDANFEDPDGNVFLDFSSCIATMNVGHSNARVLEAARRQLEKSTHAAFYDFYSEPQVRFAEELVRFLPRGLNTVFLSNSGTEAVECGMKLARWYTERPFFLAFENSFHGRTYGSLSMTCAKRVQRAGFGPFLPVVHAPFPNPYRPFGGDADRVSDACLEHIENVVFRRTPPEEIAACFIEPVQGEGGYVVPPKRFLADLTRLCRQHEILLAADEVQSGFYRTGRFLACEHSSVKPDILCLGKAAGGGFPLGVTVANKKRMSWPEGAHASTFGGNSVSCAAGLEVLHVMREPGFGEAVEKKGRLALAFLEDLKNECRLVGDVRGRGLMLAVELVKNRTTKQPAVKERDALVRRAFERGLVLLPAGESVIRVAPPLTISKQDLQAGLEIMRNVLLYKPL